MIAGDGIGTLLTSLGALAAVLGLILLIGRALRFTPLTRSVGGRHVLVVQDTIALDARRRLHLVAHGDRAVLLLTGGETDLVVGWVEPR